VRAAKWFQQCRLTPEIKTKFLATIVLEVEVFSLSDTPYGHRRVGRFGGGNFEGPKLKGTVLPDDAR
jgi:Protein of unknown function (DUF3237)